MEGTPIFPALRIHLDIFNFISAILVGVIDTPIVIDHQIFPARKKTNNIYTISSIDSSFSF